MTTEPNLNGADARLEELAALARQPVGFGLGSHGGPVLRLRRPPQDCIPTLAEHAEAVQSDPLEGVPLRGLLRIALAATRAGLRDAWHRLRWWYWAALIILAALAVADSGKPAFAIEPSRVEVDGCFAHVDTNWFLLDEIAIIHQNPDSPEVVSFTLRGSSDINAQAELNEADWKKIVAAWMACNAAGVEP